MLLPAFSLLKMMAIFFRPGQTVRPFLRHTLSRPRHPIIFRSAYPFISHSLFPPVSEFFETTTVTPLRTPVLRTTKIVPPGSISLTKWPYPRHQTFPKVAFPHPLHRRDPTRISPEMFFIIGLTSGSHPGRAFRSRPPL